MAREEFHATPSLAQLAEIVGVSTATISRVLNKRPGIGEETRQRVLEAVREHGAPRLKGSTARPEAPSGMRSIAFVIDPQVKAAIDGGGAFYSRHLLSIQSVAAAQGLYVVLLNAQESQTLAGSLRCIAEGHVQGVIAERLPTSLLRTMAERVPVVTMNLYSRVPGIDSVIPDINEAIREQLDYLYALGHRRIACFHVNVRRGWDHRLLWQERLIWEAFRTHGEEFGLEQPPEYFEKIEFGPYGHLPAIHDFMNRLFRGKHRPTAIITNDYYALAIREECLQRGISIPGDLSLVGFDDNLPDELQQIFPLTTYRQNFEEMGREAVRALVDRMATPHLASRTIAVNGVMIRRSTSAAPRE